MSRKRNLQRSSARRTRTQHADVQLLQRRRRIGVHSIAHVGEPGEVAVRVDDQDGQLSAEEELFEDDAEGIGLARAALPAPERMSVETRGLEQRGSGVVGVS